MTIIDTREFFSPEAFENPFPQYARMREHAPVCPIGDTGAFFVSTHAAVEEAVKRHEEFSANLKAMLVCGENERPYLFELDEAASASNVISTADEPAHAIHRRLMLPPLKASRIAALEHELRAFARERVDAFTREGSGDICVALTESLPAYVLIRLLDLGDDALEAVSRWAMMGGDFLAGRLDAAQLANVLSETNALRSYLSKHFDALRGRALPNRGESLTATLAGGVDDGLITREQAVGILVILFGAAGESTASLLGSAVRLLAIDQSLQERLRREPALIPNFVEEAVRLEAPFKFHYRVVRSETTLCGTQLRAGTSCCCAGPRRTATRRCGRIPTCSAWIVRRPIVTSVSATASTSVSERRSRGSRCVSRSRNFWRARSASCLTRPTHPPTCRASSSADCSTCT